MTQSDPPVTEQSTLPQSTVPALARNMGLFALIVYGVGDMVGTGIYATIGKAAALMGNAVWLAFLGSMVAAMLTGLSYASIASRYPRAAGAAFVTQHAFRLGWLSFIVGLAVTASGMTSIAAGTNAFAEALGYFAKPVPLSVIMIGYLALVTFVNFWGIRQSMWANMLCTAVEVGGILFVIAVGMRYVGGIDYLETPPPAAPDTGGASSALSLGLIMSGAVLTFYSFVGFEDMLNVAEEVKRPERNMPWGIVIALIIATILYMGVAVIGVSVVPYRELGDASKGAPFAQITRVAAPWLSPWVFTGITMFAVANTGLINSIMGSRLLYGMARQGLLPRVLGSVHSTRRTPHVAIVLLMAIVTILSLTGGGVAALASATSLLLLTSFCIVNVALVVLKYRPGEPRGQFEVPAIVPILGAIVCLSLIVVRVTAPGAGWQAPSVAGGLIVLITLLYLITRPTAITEEALAEAEHAQE